MQLEKVLRSRIFWIFTPLLIWSLVSWLGLSIKLNNFNIEVFGVTFVMGLFLIPTTFFWGISFMDNFFQSMAWTSIFSIIMILYLIIFYGLYLLFIVKIKKIEKNTLITIASIIFIFILISIVFMIANPPSF